MITALALFFLDLMRKIKPTMIRATPAPTAIAIMAPLERFLELLWKGYCIEYTMLTAALLVFSLSCWGI